MVALLFHLFYVTLAVITVQNWSNFIDFSTLHNISPFLILFEPFRGPFIPCPGIIVVPS